jgi:polyhydroxyalkanoate synthesis repressor PhaR
MNRGNAAQSSGERVIEVPPSFAFAQILNAMKTAPNLQKSIIEIRKYSNRRFYDATHSRHLTLEEIHRLVKSGQAVRVTDNRTSSDITAKVLTQIILDLDAPKLELFPAPFLAEIIRVNDQLVKGFYEKFFHQALQGFLNFQKALESQLNNHGAFPALFPPMAHWTQPFVNPFGLGHGAPENTRSEPPPSSPDSATLADLHRRITELQTQVARSKKARTRRSRSKPTDRA